MQEKLGSITLRLWHMHENLQLLPPAPKKGGKMLQDTWVGNFLFSIAAAGVVVNRDSLLGMSSQLKKEREGKGVKKTNKA